LIEKTLKSRMKKSYIKSIILILLHATGLVLLMSFKFEKLRVWKIAMELSDEIHTTALTFPDYEKFSLCNQIKKAADSVVLNIAEECTLQTDKEFKRFLVIANRSVNEVVACLYLSIRRKYIDKPRFNTLYDGYLNLVRQIQSFIKSLE
jgi:four helix bundle protein